jgi:hypothetical protein
MKKNTTKQCRNKGKTPQHNVGIMNNNVRIMKNTTKQCKNENKNTTKQCKNKENHHKTM